MKKKLAMLFLVLGLSTYTLTANAFIQFLAPLLAFDGEFTALVGSVGLHAALATILFNQNDTASNPNTAATPSTNNLQMQVNIDPAVPKSAPAGWTKAATPTTTPTTNPEPTPPSTAASSYGPPYTGADDNGNAIPSEPDQTSAMNAVLSNYCSGNATCIANNGPAYLGSGNWSGQPNSYWVDAKCTGTKSCPWGYEGIGHISLTKGCPAGYSTSGSSCALSNASAVQKPSDGICSISRSGNTFQWDMNDPDCLLAQNKSGTPGVPSIATGGGQIQTTHADGSTSTVTINNNGTTTIQVNTPTTDANGNPQTVINTINVSAPAAAGQPVQKTTNTGTSTNTYQGTGDSQNSTANSTMGVTGTVNCSGCAQDTTLQQTNAKLDAIKGNLQDSNGNSYLSRLVALISCTDGSDCTTTNVDKQTSNAGTSMDNTTTNINNIGSDPLNSHGWSFGFTPEWPWSAETCTPFQLQLPLSGGTVELDWCDQIARARNFFGWILYIYTAFQLFQIVTSRSSEGEK